MYPKTIDALGTGATNISSQKRWFLELKNELLTFEYALLINAIAMIPGPINWM
jgi:hypothetical protein